MKRIEDHFGAKVQNRRRMTGGCVGDVWQLALSDGRKLVAKIGGDQDNLDLEGWMLGMLAEHGLPVPAVHLAESDLLVMDLLAGSPIGSSPSRLVEVEAGRAIAHLHRVGADRFGLERATLIGGLHQPNPWTDSWIEFFRDHRLLYMAEKACEAGKLPASLRNRIETIAGDLPQLITEPQAPALLHGDLWGGNVLTSESGLSGFIDPAIYHGHPEIELAFTQLFGTFGEPFFAAYEEITSIEPGFFEERRALYNLYPLLVHVCLFGGGYVSQVDRVLARFGR